MEKSSASHTDTAVPTRKREGASTSEQQRFRDAALERARTGFYRRFGVFAKRLPSEMVTTLALLMSVEGCTAAGIRSPAEEPLPYTLEQKPKKGESALLEGLPSQEEMLAKIEQVHGSGIRAGLFDVSEVQALGVSLGGRTERNRLHTPPDDVGPGRPDVRVSYDVGLSREECQHILEAGWPRTWVAPEVTTLVIEDFREAMIPETHNAKTGAYMSHGVGIDPSRIHVGGERLAAAEWIGLSFSHIVGHELAHSNDALRSNTLRTPERIALLYRVQQRALAADRTRFPYVEKTFMEKGNAAGITEYWAEMMAVALTVAASSEAAWRGGVLQRVVRAGYGHAHQVQKDLDVVVRYLRDAAPGFKPWEAATNRLAVEGDIMRAAVRKRMEAAAGMLPAGAVKAHVVAFMTRPEEQDSAVAPEEIIRANASIAEETLLWDAQNASSDLMKDKAYVQALQQALQEEREATDAAAPPEIAPLLAEYHALEGHLESWRHWERWASSVQGWRKPDALPFVFGAVWRAKSLAALVRGIQPGQGALFEEAVRRRQEAFTRAVQRAREVATPSAKLSYRVQAMARHQAEKGPFL